MNKIKIKKIALNCFNAGKQNYPDKQFEELFEAEYEELLL